MGATGATGANGLDGATGATGANGPLVGLQSIVNISNGITSNGGGVDNILIYNNTYSNSLAPQTISINDNVNSVACGLSYERLAIQDNVNNTGFNAFSNGVSRLSSPTYWNTSQSYETVIEKLTTTEKSILGSSSLSITDTSSNVALLTTTNLTFNGVSYNSDVSILQIKQTNTTLQNISAAITADGKAPTAPTSTIVNTYAFSPAWYMKNSVAGQKCNWYIAPDLSMTVADVLGLYMYIFNGITNSNDNSPFIVIYTKPQSGDPLWYRSKRVYIFNQSVTPVQNTRYCMFTDLSGACPTPSYYGQILNNMQLSPVGGSNVGPFAPDEEILAFAISSNSASAVDSVEFAISKFGIMTANGTQEVAFIPL
jgi:hypothetical protein